MRERYTLKLKSGHRVKIRKGELHDIVTGYVAIRSLFGDNVEF